MKIIVLDDDPTGSQTVYGCNLILKLEKKIILDSLKDSSPLLFILVNTRAMTALKAERTIRKVCKILKDIVLEERLKSSEFLIVSRGDSTLRGHGVLEPKILNEELGPFDATFHVPAFIEGNRTTSKGVHQINGVPVHLTNFAKDRNFPYSTSFLPDWLQEKSQGEILSKDVMRINDDQLDLAIQSEEEKKILLQNLLSLKENKNVVVDSINKSQLDLFAEIIKEAFLSKKFIFRSAASLIGSLSDLPKDSYDKKDLISLRLKDCHNTYKSGLISVGSHVDLADQQLRFLLKNSKLEGIELPVDSILRFYNNDYLKDDIQYFQDLIVKKIKEAIVNLKTPVLYTSRKEITFMSIQNSLRFGQFLAIIMANIVAKILPELGYIISKGGTTTQMLLNSGLNLGSVKLKGQILPGLSVVCPQSNKIKPIPIITFPGNLGNEKTLYDAWKLIEDN